MRDFNGKSSASEWVGEVVRTAVPIKATNGCQIPAGSAATVTGVYRGLYIRTAPCPHCGERLTAERVEYHALTEADPFARPDLAEIEDRTGRLLRALWERGIGVRICAVLDTNPVFYLHDHRSDQRFGPYVLAGSLHDTIRQAIPAIEKRRGASLGNLDVRA